MVDRIRTMRETTYAELKPGDCAWITGALLKVRSCWPARGNVRFFDADVVRPGATYSEGDYAVFSGLGHGHVLCEVLPAPSPAAAAAETPATPAPGGEQ